MRALIQRVKKASVSVNTEQVSTISEGLLVLLGISKNDNKNDCDYLVYKLLNLRIFPSEKNNFDKSVLEEQKEVLIVSQFTLYANTRVGRRPDFSDSAKSTLAEELYNYAVNILRSSISVKTGKFGEEMEVSLVNWGPVTLAIDSSDKDKARNSF